MKKRTSLLILSAIAALSSSCNNDDYFVIPDYANADEVRIELTTETHNGTTIDNVYSGQSAGGGGDFEGTLFTMNNGIFSFLSRYIADAGYGYSFYAGFTMSSNFETSPSAGSGGFANYDYQFSAYADGDYDGDGIFINAYYSGGYEMTGLNGETYDVPDYTPIIKLSEDHDLHNVRIANNATTVSYGAPETFFITIYCTDIDGIVENVDINMLDDDGNFIKGWIRADLVDFDDIELVRFEVNSSDPYMPTYFCIDAFCY